MSCWVATRFSTRLSTPGAVSRPSPEKRTRRVPVLSLPMNHRRTRCDERHHVPRSNQTPVVEPRQTALACAFLSHSGSHGSWSQYCSSGVRRTSECIVVLANEKSGRRRSGRMPGHDVKPAGRRDEHQDLVLEMHQGRQREADAPCRYCHSGLSHRFIVWRWSATNEGPRGSVSISRPSYARRRRELAGHVSGKPHRLRAAEARVRCEREVGSGARGGRTLHPRRSRPPPSRPELRGRDVRRAQGECERLEGPSGRGTDLCPSWPSRRASRARRAPS